MIHSPNFEGRKNSGKSGSVVTNSDRFLASCGSYNDTLPRKRPDSQKSGFNLFYRTLMAIVGGPIKIKNISNMRTLDIDNVVVT